MAAAEGPPLVHLEHPDELAAAGYRDMMDSDPRRNADRRQDVFVAEGARVIRQLLDQHWPLVSLLLAPARLHARPDLAVDAARTGATVYLAPQEVFDRITGYHVHRGALALAWRPPARRVAEVAAEPGPTVVVEGVNDHENMGSLFRNAAAFAAGGVILDPTAVDPLYRRSVRVSLGHVLRVPFARASSWPGDLDVVRASGRSLVALTPGGNATLDELAAVAGGAGPPGWALMVGAEGAGLSPAALEAADITVRIPMAPGVDSLNVATAVAVALSRLAPG